MWFSIRPLSFKFDSCRQNLAITEKPGAKKSPPPPGRGIICHSTKLLHASVKGKIRFKKAKWNWNSILRLRSGLLRNNTCLEFVCCEIFLAFFDVFCGCSRDIVGAQFDFVGARAPTKRYKTPPLAHVTPADKTKGAVTSMVQSVKGEKS